MREGWLASSRAGPYLAERDLARDLSMSRTPVREALRLLAFEGFLDRVPGGAYVPRRLTRRDVRDHYDLRSLLEPRAAALAAERWRQRGSGVTELLFQNLHQTLNGADFHNAVARVSGDSALAQTIEVLNDHPASQWMLAGEGDSSQPFDHGEVVRGIETGDSKDAAAMMLRHLENRKALIDVWPSDLKSWRLVTTGPTHRGKLEQPTHLGGRGADKRRGLMRADQLTLGAEAYTALHDAIVSGRLEPGDLLVEGDLANLLKVSRTPVREALLRLEVEGYASRDERGRLEVCSFWLDDADDADDWFSVLEMLEAYAVGLAAERASDTEIDALGALIDAEAAALLNGQTGRIPALNTRIHDLIVGASRNRVLSTLLSRLRGRAFGLSGHAGGSKQILARFAQDHDMLWQLIGQGDGPGAVQVACHHLRMAQTVFMERLGLQAGARPFNTAE